MKKLLSVCLAGLGLGIGQANAALLLVDGSGILTGATGVMVSGTAYDVRFEAGSCNSVFDGCDPAEDLLFTSGASALAASQALLDQVFLGENPGNIDPFTPGLFDSRPGLTQGCTAGAFDTCMALTPYGFAGGISLLAGSATNYGSRWDGERTDVAMLSGLFSGATATSGIQTFAVWSLSPVSPVTSVPEPPTWALLGASLAALMLPFRRTRRIGRVQ